MKTDPRIEAAAKGICAAQFPDVDGAYAWNVQFNDGKEEYLAEARAALAAADAVDPLRQPGHRVDIQGFQWTLQHPAECRPDMLACTISTSLAKTAVGALADGTYLVTQTGDDGALDLAPEVEL